MQGEAPRKGHTEPGMPASGKGPHKGHTEPGMPASGKAPRRGRTEPGMPAPVSLAPEQARSAEGHGLEVSDILDALPFYVLLVDDQHHILEANNAVVRQLG